MGAVGNNLTLDNRGGWRVQKKSDILLIGGGTLGFGALEGDT